MISFLDEPLPKEKVISFSAKKPEEQTPEKNPGKKADEAFTRKKADDSQTDDTSSDDQDRLAALKRENPFPADGLLGGAPGCEDLEDTVATPEKAGGGGS